MGQAGKVPRVLQRGLSSLESVFVALNMSFENQTPSDQQGTLSRKPGERWAKSGFSGTWLLLGKMRQCRE